MTLWQFFISVVIIIFYFLHSVDNTLLETVIRGTIFSVGNLISQQLWKRIPWLLEIVCIFHVLVYIHISPFEKNLFTFVTQFEIDYLQVVKLIIHFEHFLRNKNYLKMFSLNKCILSSSCCFLFCGDFNLMQSYLSIFPFVGDFGLPFRKSLPRPIKWFLPVFISDSFKMLCLTFKSISVYEISLGSEAYSNTYF